MTNGKKDVFVSLPMRDLSDDEIRTKQRAVFEKWCRTYRLHPNNFNLMDTIIHTDCSLRTLGKSLEKMADADLVLFSQDFGGTHGCRVEWHAATVYSKEVYYV